MNNLSLYIHIPFCIKKCNYCDFLSAACDEKTKQEYVNVLCFEMIQRAKQIKHKKVDTIFFGGGTPSVLSKEQITQIMSTVRKEFHILPEAEISMELNPGTVTGEKLETYQKLGINRLSIGLQSADNEELKILGRIHTWEVFLQTWNLVREKGFTNVNIDLMSALPGQTLESYECTLRKVLALKPEHISAYSLIIEEGTKFYEWFGEGSEIDIAVKEENKAVQHEDKIQEKSSESENVEIKGKELPDEITDRQMYDMTRELLKEYGYHRYEISNYSLKGYECKHNIGYWKRKEYLGLGLGAASLISNIRSSNINNLTEYLKLGKNSKQKTFQALEDISEQKTLTIPEDISEQKNAEVKEDMLKKKNPEINVKTVDTINWSIEQEELSVTEQMEEFMFLGLRMMEGVSLSEFEKQFGVPLEEVYGKQISKLEKQGLLEFCKETGRYTLTLQGIDVSNQVFVVFLN